MLHKALEQAVVWEKIPKNPAALATPPQDDERDIKYWSDKEGERFLVLIRGEYIWLPCFIVFYTGLRIGEVLALKWENIDLGEGVLHVRLNIIWDKDNKQWKVVEKVKSKKSKDYLYMPKVLTEQLQKEWARQRQAQAMVGEDDVPIHPMEFICRGSRNPFMTPSHTSQRFTELVERHSMKKITFHGLRHTHATILYKRGATSQEISKRLRHSRVATTDDIYIHVDDEMRRRTADFLNRPPAGHQSDNNGSGDDGEEK